MITDIILAWATLALAVFACISSLLTIIVIRKNKKDYLVDAHFKFQTRFRELQKQFPPEVNDEDQNGKRIWEPNETRDENYKELVRSIEHYWYFVFDEWFFCNVQDKRLNLLWDSIYSFGVAGALKIPGFKNEINRIMQKKNISLFNKQDSFFNEIKRIDKEINNIACW